MFKNWDFKRQENFYKSYNKIDWLIDLVSNIRSTKVNLNVAPGTYIDISTAELDSDKTSLINNNIEVFKRLGRVSNINNHKNGKDRVKIIVGRETITLYFDQTLDLNEQKQNISKKIEVLNKKIEIANNKLKNKSFLKNAPKQIVQREKGALINYKIELKKLNSILNSIKN